MLFFVVLLSVENDTFYDLCVCCCCFFSYETPERTIYDESGIAYTDAHLDNRLECTELQSGGKSCVQMKSEPSGGASSPESTAETTNLGPDDCAGCGRLIQVCNFVLPPSFFPPKKKLAPF